MTQVIRLPYHTGTMDFPVPPGWSVTTAEPEPWPPAGSVESLLKAAMKSPLDSPSLSELSRGARTAAVVITDATRPCPDAEILPLILQAMEQGGLAKEAVSVVVALGMHRPSTNEELRSKLGSLFGKVQLIESQGADATAFVSLGELRGSDWPAPVPMEIHRSVVDADLVVATGVVEPHQYAGYSGGRKTVAIGCASGRTIGILHGAAFLDAPGTRLGRLDSNPVHSALEAIASKLNLRYAVNVVRSSQGTVAGAAAGSPTAVLQHLAGLLEPHTWTRVGTEPFDVVLLGVASPKDANLYQASRALTYMAYSPAPVLKPGGWVVLAASTPEGAGQGPGEREFLARMSSAESPAALRSKLQAHGFGAGGQRAYMVAGALARYKVMIVGSRTPEAAEAVGFQPAASPAEAVDAMIAHLPRAKVLAVPHALSTLTVLG